MIAEPYRLWNPQDLRSGLWARSGLPLRHREFAERPGSRLTAEQVECAHDATQHMRSGGMAVLLGDRGTGKTQIAVEIARNLIDTARITVLYTRADEMFRRLRRWDDSDERTFDNQLKTVGLLIVDEIQDRGETDFEDRELTRIIDARYGAVKPTLLVGNASTKTLNDRLGPSVISRITEGGGVVECRWQSFRTPHGATA